MTNTDRGILSAVLALEGIRALPELGRIARRGGASAPPAWRLPLIVAEALGAPPGAALPAAAALACVQLGVVLIDDLLDGDPRGEHVRLGAGRAANLAVAFLAASGEALSAGRQGRSAGRQARSAGLHEPERLARAQAALAEAVGRVAVGQHLDVGGAEDEAAYWRIAAAKSGAFFGLAFHLGALLSPASFNDGLALEVVGGLYGEMVQIHDDLRDCLEAPAGPDWRAGRRTLPMLYAQKVPHPERDQFCERRAEIAALLKVDAPAEEVAPVLAEAQAMLVRSGAISYGLDQILRRDAEARERLASIAQQTQGVTRVLDEIVAPVRALLMGAEALRA
mgnify:CR=1 FL=1